MSHVGFGISTSYHAKEAAREAALHALDQVGTSRPVWAVVFASEAYSLADLQPGLAGALGPIPYWGFTTPASIHPGGDIARGVMVVIFTGADRKARIYNDAYPEGDAPEVGKKLAQAVRDATGSNISALLLACNGMWGDPTGLLNGLAGFSAPVSGCVSSVARPPSAAFLITAGSNASTGFVAAVLSGRFRVATGWGHGWKPLTSSRRVTASEKHILRAIDHQPAVHFYAETFGYQDEDWLKAPLNEIVRLYPLGVQSGMFTSEIQLRSPVFVRPDGSLELNSAVTEGKMVKLMLGDLDQCLAQARSAGQQALRELGKARPIFALVFVDAAWRLLFKANPKIMVTAIQEGLAGLPFAGAYTHGQVVQIRKEAPPALLNQHIQIVVIGEN